MAMTSTSLRLRLTSPFPSPRGFLPSESHGHRSLTVRAADTNTNTDTEAETPKPDSKTLEPESDDFESRISRLRLRNRSGLGNKAEIRKANKKASSGSGRSGSGVYLPPIPLKEPESDGLKVGFGFCPYSERINGRIAILGLTALVLVELATGKGVINYHTPAIVLLQVYAVAAISAVYIKYEKERVSVWPPSSSGKD